MVRPPIPPRLDRPLARPPGGELRAPTDVVPGWMRGDGLADHEGHGHELRHRCSAAPVGTARRDTGPADAPKPNTAMLKGDIDSGRSGDKVEVFDPGMAMLGTCEEVAATPCPRRTSPGPASPRSRNGGACRRASPATRTTAPIRRSPSMSASSASRGWASPPRSGSSGPPRERGEPPARPGPRRSARKTGRASPRRAGVWITPA